jgi:threonine aldolase
MLNAVVMMFTNKIPTVIVRVKVAEMFGMEAGLFFPSGTMANQTAINCTHNLRTIDCR